MGAEPSRNLGFDGREMCEFNQFGDVRICIDWDRGTTH